MAQPTVSDLDHYEHVGKVRDLSLDDETWVEYIRMGESYGEVPINSFAMGQLLKFGGLKKSKAKSMDTDEIVWELGSKELVFKRTEDRILAVVSKDFKDIATDYINQIVEDTWEALGVKVSDIEVERGLVTRVWYEFDEDEMDGLEPGVHLRNSVFGASALGLNRFYIIQDTGSRLQLTDSHVYKRYHVGDTQQVREEVSEAASDMVHYMWSDLGKVRSARRHEMTIEEQVSLIEQFNEDRKITKEMSNQLIQHVERETWSSGRETVWDFIRTSSGYATFADLSAQNRKRVQRMAETTLESQTRPEEQLEV